MPSLTRTTPARLLAAAITAGALAASAPATVVAPGASLNPVPAGFLPSGAVLERTVTKDFDFTLSGGFPIPNHLRGTVTQGIYRLTDNTILFTYTLTNASNSNAGITDFYVRDLADYTSDIYQAFVIGGSTYAVDSAARSIDGSSVHFAWDLNIPTASTGRMLIVKTSATAYSVPGRILPIADRATICTGSSCFSLYGLAYPVDDSTPPVVSIAAPTQLTCVCSPAAITGTAYDPNGFDSYTIEYSSSPNGPWTSIAASSTPVASTGTLGSWNTAGLTQGYYFLRLTATNSTGMTTAVTSIVFVDQQFDTVDLRAPQTGNILGGSVCFDGTVQDGNSGACFNNYRVEYAPLPAAAPFLPVDPANAQYTTPITNDGLAGWNTRTGAAAVADGNYRVRITGTDDCGHTRSVTRDITIDNTAPVGVISSPAPCSNITGAVTISGTVSDAHLAGWTLQYTGGDAHGWVTIASGNSNVSGPLATWNTAGLRPCAYTVRLLASDASGVNCGSTTNQAEYEVSVYVGCPGDFNHNGSVSVQDIFDFLSAYFVGCP